MGEGKSRVGPVAAVGSVTVIAAAQTKPEDAISNIGGWLKLLGIDRVPPFLATSETDAWVTAIGSALLIASLVWWWRNKRRHRGAAAQVDPAYRDALGKREAEAKARSTMEIKKLTGGLFDQVAWGQRLLDDDERKRHRKGDSDAS